MPKAPAIVALDLDAHVWITEQYLLDGPPFGWNKRGQWTDRSGNVVELADGVEPALQQIHSEEVFADTLVAYVSRTHYAPWAQECLEALTFDEGKTLSVARGAAELSQIYPGDKKTHFRKIHKATGIPYERMIFFDNERRNVTSVAELGVVCVWAPDGFTKTAWEQGLRDFAKSPGGQ
jgi:magnesium-dependent phosphatase 1